MILGGGCFWCLEHDLESLKGINFVQSGYSGGDLQNPTYENHEGHQEVVLVNYDYNLVTLPEILRLYFRNIDPLDGKGQFCDRGDSYRPVIFFKDETEESDANNASDSTDATGATNTSDTSDAGFASRASARSVACDANAASGPSDKDNTCINTDTTDTMT